MRGGEFCEIIYLIIQGASIIMQNSKELPEISRRSYIGISGLKPEVFPQALASGADMVGVDLEGIAPKDKAIARKNAIGIFEALGTESGLEGYVRTNCVREAYGLADIQAVLATDTPPHALMLPKVGTAEEVIWLDNLLTERGHNCLLHVIIETNEGLEFAAEISQCSSRIGGLFFGGHDMSDELRCQNAWQPLLHARARLVHAAALAGIDAIDTPFTDPDDQEGLKREATLARELGFTGKGSIHPKQIPILNEIFSPEQSTVKHVPGKRWYC